MGDLAADVELDETGPGVFQRTLSRDWEIWGPNGGYVAAVALRAARHVTDRARPANLSAHFLGVANFDDPVTVTARIQRATRQATSVHLQMDQGDRAVLSAMVWAVDDELDGLVHDDAPMPDVPRWADCPTIAERWADSGGEPPNQHGFWTNFEQRPTSWIADWAQREPSRPLYQNWLRFLEGGATTDPWTQAERLLVLVDFAGWPAVSRAHLDQSWIAPSLDVSCEFHRPGTGDEWLFLRAESPVGRDGLIGTHQQVWNADGELLASGISHLFCRRVR